MSTDPPEASPTEQIAVQAAQTLVQRALRELRNAQLVPTLMEAKNGWEVGPPPYPDAVAIMRDEVSRLVDLCQAATSTDNDPAPDGRSRSVWEDPSRDWTPEGLLDRAGWLCRQVACTTWLPDTPARVDMADRYDYDEHELTTRLVDVGALAALDRELLAWLGTQLQYASRRVRGRGVHGADVRAVKVAEALVRNGGVRPAGQEPIAMWPHDGDQRDFAAHVTAGLQDLGRYWKTANTVNRHPHSCTCETCEWVIFGMKKLGISPGYSLLQIRALLVLADVAPQPLTAAQLAGELKLRYDVDYDTGPLAIALAETAAAGHPVEQPEAHGPYVWTGVKP
jgi:hypothetical protein